MKLKKIASLFLILCFIFSFAACKDSGNSEKIKVSWKSGELSAPGDVFTLPEMQTSTGAPIIGELSRQVNPGNSITVTGEGFTGAKAYIYSQSDKNNGNLSEAQVSFVDDTNVVVTVDKSLKYGAYGIYFQNEIGKSNIQIVNKPGIWWIGFTTLAAGDDINVYGENLTSENGEGKTYGYLVAKDGKYCELKVKYADPYKATFAMPDGLTDGEEYTLKLHNGHGGDSAWAEAPEKIRFSKSKVNNFTGKKINVKDYGADAEDNGNDDTSNIQKAVDAADNGDIIYFPAGVYNIKGSITVNKSVKFEGIGDKSVIVNCAEIPENNNNVSQTFTVNQGPCEFEKLFFKDVREGKLVSGFIESRNSYDNSGSFSLNVHDCRFLQSSKERKLQYCIVAQYTQGILISDNRFEATAMLWSNNSKKVFMTGNDYCGVFYTGPYYNQNCVLLWTTNMFDASNNDIYGKKKITDNSGYISTDGDFTAGRAFAVQGFNYNHYIANNNIERTGLPADNAGEQIMLENMSNKYNGFASGASANSVTLDKALSIQANSVVAITKGKGVGQWRFLKKIKGKELILDRDWEIIPDESSRILVSSCFHNYAIYNNLFDCFTNHAEMATATCAVQIYGNTYNCYINKNIMKNMAYGVCVTSHYITKKDQENLQNVVYWTYIDNNDINNVSLGIRFILACVIPGGSGPIPMYTSLGVAVRNNEFKDIVDFKATTFKQGLGGVGVLLGTVNYDYVNRPETNTWVGPWEYGSLIENNVFKDNEIANILLYKHQGGTVLIANKASGKVSDVYTVDKNGAAPAVYK